MQRLLDALVSGVHDTKNQLFIAESLITACEAKHHVDLGEARYAIEAAANRLSRTLSTYRLLRHGANLAIVPVILSDLCEEVVLAQQRHLAASNIALSVDCQVFDEWPLDRDLVTDMLNNAVQNASRYARTKISLTILPEGNGLILRVDDDGPGFSHLPPSTGIGLVVAERLAAMHTRHDKHGSLHLGNDSALGGARFELHLP